MIIRVNNAVLFIVLEVTYCISPQYGQIIPVSNVKDFFQACFQLHLLLHFWQV